MRVLSPGRLVTVGAILLAVVVAAAWATPSRSFLIVPDPAKPLAEHVKVEGEKPADAGGIYYVDVIVRKASILERVLPPTRPDGSALVPAHSITPPGTSLEERRRQNANQMTRSQEVAAAVALKAYGSKVTIENRGILVSAVAPDGPAQAADVRATDIVVAVDGKSVRTPAQLRAAIAKHRIGSKVVLDIRRNGKSLRLTTTTVDSPTEPGRPIVGIQVDQAATIKLPLDVKIDLGGVGGPSAGLAFALDILEELGRNVDRGYRVAATGQLELDGTVTPIGGVAQKTIGAKRAGAEVFLVPAGDNAADARREAHGLRIIAVESFQQALRALATLPKKR